MFLNRVFQPLPFQFLFRFCRNVACSDSDKLTTVIRERRRSGLPGSAWNGKSGDR